MINHAQLTIRAADIAERIVDEISQSEQDWLAIERHARSLVRLLALGAPRIAPPAPEPSAARAAVGASR
jgi:hypothetical protein